MGEPESAPLTAFHSHVFLGEGHEKSERRTWAVIWLCGAMMALEILGGWLFGSIALIADGLHMSTHAGALLLAALAYSFARRYANDPRFTFGTGNIAYPHTLYEPRNWILRLARRAMGRDPRPLHRS